MSDDVWLPDPDTRNPRSKYARVGATYHDLKPGATLGFKVGGVGMLSEVHLDHALLNGVTGFRVRLGDPRSSVEFSLVLLALRQQPGDESQPRGPEDQFLSDVEPDYETVRYVFHGALNDRSEIVALYRTVVREQKFAAGSVDELARTLMDRTLGDVDMQAEWQRSMATENVGAVLQRSHTEGVPGYRTALMATTWQEMRDRGEI